MLIVSRKINEIWRSVRGCSKARIRHAEYTKTCLKIRERPTLDTRAMGF